MKSFILLLALSTPLFARLGETMEQCIDRYGKPTKVTEKETNFLKSGITIIVRFHHNKVVSIFYNRKDEKLAESEIKSLIETNLPNIELTLVESKPNSYEDKDKLYHVLEGSTKSYLLIREVKGSLNLLKEDENTQKKEAEKSLEGF